MRLAGKEKKSGVKAAHGDLRITVRTTVKSTEGHHKRRLANLLLSVGQEMALCTWTVHAGHIWLYQLEVPGAGAHAAFHCCLITSSHLTLSSTTAGSVGSTNQGQFFARPRMWPAFFWGTVIEHELFWACCYLDTNTSSLNKMVIKWKCGIRKTEQPASELPGRWEVFEEHVLCSFLLYLMRYVPEKD